MSLIFFLCLNNLINIKVVPVIGVQNLYEPFALFAWANGSEVKWCLSKFRILGYYVHTLINM